MFSTLLFSCYQLQRSHAHVIIYELKVKRKVKEEVLNTMAMVMET